MGKRRTPFVKDEDDFYVVPEAAGISMLIMGFDGLPMIRFTGDRRVYMRVDDAIAWHTKELAESKGRSGNQEILDLLKQAKQQYLDGVTEPE